MTLGNRMITKKPMKLTSMNHNIIGKKNRVLVTGADGFIGRKLVEALRASEFCAIPLSLENGDITEISFPEEGVDHVIHLAALTSVPASWDNQKEFYRVNVLGTANVLENCVRHNCSCVFMSTYVYGQPLYNPVDEQHPINPNSPYSHSKVLGESLCDYYHKTFGVPIVIMRPFNIFGFGQNSSFLIPTIIRQLFDPRKKTIELMDLSPSRDYIYVDDVIEALLRTLSSEHTFDLFNLASGTPMTVQDVTTVIQAESDRTKPINCIEQKRKNEVSEITGAITHARDVLGWEPQYSFRDGIRAMLRDWKGSNE